MKTDADKPNKNKRIKPRNKRQAVSSTKAKSKDMESASAPVVKVRSNGLHKANSLKGKYDFDLLGQLVPELAQRVSKNPKGDTTISFSDPISVKLLNQGLLAQHFDIKFWDIPKGYLCPPIPGRADYIHRAAAMLEKSLGRKPSELNHLDIGAGANCIYPLVGCQAYQWNSVGSDIDPLSVSNAAEIAQKNTLKGKIELRLQQDKESFFKGVISPDERYHVTTCNPPFHQSAQDAAQGTQRKASNLKKSREKRGNKVATKPTSTALNFGGQNNELWCDGGESRFIRLMAS